MSGPCCRTPQLGEEPGYSEHLARLIAGVIGRAQASGDAPIVIGRDIVKLAAVKALLVAPAVQAEKPAADEGSRTDGYAEALRWFRKPDGTALLDTLASAPVESGMPHLATIVRAALDETRPAKANADNNDELTALCPQCWQPRGRCEHTEGESMFGAAQQGPDAEQAGGGRATCADCRELVKECACTEVF